MERSRSERVPRSRPHGRRKPSRVLSGILARDRETQEVQGFTRATPQGVTRTFNLIGSVSGGPRSQL